MKLKVNEANNPPFLSIDLGDRYIGTAFSEAGILVSPGDMIDRQGKSDNQIFRQVAEIIRSKEIQTLVVGLPISDDGSENERCQKIREFITALDAHIGPPLLTAYSLRLTAIFVPEDFSSIDAHLLPKPKLNQKTKTSSHSQAAQIILERYLEQ